MALDYTSDQLIQTIRNIGQIPDASSPGSTDADLLRHAVEALRTKIYPHVLRHREEYFVVTTRTSTVANQARHRIPTRAAGNKLRDIFLVDSSNNRQALRQILREDLDAEDFNDSGSPDGYYIEGNYAVLVPTPSGASDQVEMAFYFSPSDLVLASAARQVSVVVSSTVIESATAFPASFVTTARFDVHGSESGAEIRSWDLQATTITSSTPFRMTFTTAIDGSVFGTNAIQVGDWICLARESVIPALPRELHPMLARATALRFAESLGAVTKAQIHDGLLRQDLEAATQLLNPRVEGRPPVILGHRGLLWEGRHRW